MRLTSRPERATVPLNLIVGSAPALVVGGGQVGARKVRGLLEAGASVALVCPEACAELVALAEAGRIVWHRGPFEPGQVRGRFLVYACTDDKHVNRAVLDAARSERVLCGCADGNWADGDFTTPAVARANGATVAVSTNGRSCRSARDLKNEIAALLSADDGADELLVLGTSDAFLPSRRRAPYHLPPEERVRVARLVRGVKGVREFLVLNTCNRVELVALCSPREECDELLERIVGFDRLAKGEYFVHRGFAAHRHLARVVAGLESSLLGEYHVVAQFKGAVAEAADAGWSGARLKGVADEILRVAKDVRHAVEGLLPVAEIDQVAVRYLSVHGGIEADTRVCVVGTGVVGTGVAAALLGRAPEGASMFATPPLRSRPRVTRVYHSRPPERIADEAVRPFSELRAALAEADVVVTAVDSARPVVSPEFAGCFAGRDVLMVDLGLPRNIDPSFDECGRGVTVADLDDLKLWHRVKSGVLAELEARAGAVIAAAFGGAAD